MAIELKPMTFAEMRDAAADDLREVAKLLNARADEVAAGDIAAFYSVLVEDFAKWQEMLMFRQSHRAERREVSESPAPETGREYPAMHEAFLAVDNIAERLAVLAAGCRDKEVDELVDQERIALAIVGGCEWERTETGIRVTDAFGIQKIDGKFIVARRSL